MVSDGDTRDYPAYALEQVRALAEKSAVVTTTNVEDCMEDLSYERDDLYALLGTLQPSDFHKSHWFEKYQQWFDAYLVSYTGPSGNTDILYIKFRLTSSCCAISVLRFHLSR